MNPELSDVLISEIRKGRIQRKAKVEDGYFLLSKVCSTKLLFNYRALITHIYIEHKKAIGL